MVQLLHPVYLPSPSPRLGHVSIPLRSFAQNQTNSVFCDRWLNWMGFFYSEYHAGSCGFNPPSGSISHGHSNQGRIVSVVLLAFSNPKVIAGSRLCWMRHPTPKRDHCQVEHVETAANSFYSEEKGIIGKKCHASSVQRVKCKAWNDKWQTHIGCTHFIVKSLVLPTRYVILFKLRPWSLNLKIK